MPVLSDRFFDRFKGLTRVYGIYPDTRGRKANSKGKILGKTTAQTLVGEVTPALWVMHLQGTQSLGIVPINDKSECRFGAIDIDLYEGLDLKRLETQVKQINAPLMVIRSKSGGAHLYLFLSAPTPAKLVRGRLIEWAVALGYPKVEIFPKQIQLANDDDAGSWINMPYFDGDNSVRYAIKDGASLTSLEFLDAADKLAVSPDELKKLKIKMS